MKSIFLKSLANSVNHIICRIVIIKKNLKVKFTFSKSSTFVIHIFLFLIRAYDHVNLYNKFWFR